MVSITLSNFLVIPGLTEAPHASYFLSYNPNCVGPSPKNIAPRIFVNQVIVIIFVIGEVTFILLVAL
jgi:hypothetical protein